MILTEKEYPILWAGIKKIAVNQYDRIKMLEDFFRCYEERFDHSFLLSIVKGNKWADLPKVDIDNFSVNSIYINKQNQCTWLHELPEKKFNIIVKTFKEHGLDLILALQHGAECIINNANPKYVTHEDNFIYLQSTEAFARSVINNFYVIDTPEKEKLFLKALEKHVELLEGYLHLSTVGLLIKAVELNIAQDTVLPLFKKFVTEAKINDSKVHKQFEILLDKIKDWNVEKYFNLAERKKLFKKDSGFEVKQGDILIYDFNVTKIQAKNNHLTSATIGKRLRTLAFSFSKELGDLDDYIHSSNIFSEPEIEICIVFEQGTAKKYKGALDEMFEHIINTKDDVDSTYVSKLIQSHLLRIDLNSRSPEAENKTKKTKV